MLNKIIGYFTGWLLGTAIGYGIILLIEWLVLGTADFGFILDVFASWYYWVAIAIVNTIAWRRDSRKEREKSWESPNIEWW